MKPRLFWKVLLVLTCVLGGLLGVQLVRGLVGGGWELTPLQPAIVSSMIYQLATCSPHGGERQRVPPVAAVLVVATGAVALASAVLVWPGGDTSDRIGAVIAVATSAFFSVELVRRHPQPHGAARRSFDTPDE